jgi:hypothetical protein
LGAKGVAGVSASVIDNLITSIGKGSDVTLTPTTPATTTTYNANITGTVDFVLGSVDYTIVLDPTSTVAATLSQSGILTIIANVSGQTTISGLALGDIPVVVTITLAQ